MYRQNVRYTDIIEIRMYFFSCCKYVSTYNIAFHIGIVLFFLEDHIYIIHCGHKNYIQYYCILCRLKCLLQYLPTTQTNMFQTDISFCMSEIHFIMTGDPHKVLMFRAKRDSVGHITDMLFFANSVCTLISGQHYMRTCWIFLVL